MRPCLGRVNAAVPIRPCRCDRVYETCQCVLNENETWSIDCIIHIFTLTSTVFDKAIIMLKPHAVSARCASLGQVCQNVLSVSV